MQKHNKLFEKFKKRVAITSICASKENQECLKELAFNFSNQNDRIVFNFILK